MAEQRVGFDDHPQRPLDRLVDRYPRSLGVVRERAGCPAEPGGLHQLLDEAVELGAGPGRTLEVGTFRRIFTVILPAAAPTIVTGMRISIGIAWLVIVAAEMLVGGTGIGYFVWNEWNNLSITNVIIAILMIGLVGMLLDQMLARVGRLVTFPE